MIFYTWDDLLKNQLKRFHKDKMDVLQAWKNVCDYSIRDAKQLLSGSVKTRTLKRLGHPFARKKGKSKAMRGIHKSKSGLAMKLLGAGARTNQLLGLPILPKLPINTQKGNLLRSLSAKIVRTGKKVELPLKFNRSIAGKHLLVLNRGGTQKMIDRGFYEEMERRLSARNAAFRRARRNKWLVK